MDLKPNEDQRAMYALRWLLLPSAALAGWVACAYLFGDPIRTNTPSFRVAQDLASMDAWGIVFAIGAVALVVSALIGKPALIASALFVGGAIYSWWASLFLVTLLLDDRASIVAPATWYFVAFSHFAGGWRMYTRQPRA